MKREGRGKEGNRREKEGKRGKGKRTRVSWLSKRMKDMARLHKDSLHAF